jgi:hypothetical protein
MQLGNVWVNTRLQLELGWNDIYQLNILDMSWSQIFGMEI